jgi:hypothetical protein
MDINIFKALRIYKSNKDFIVYNLKNNKLDKYILTNNLSTNRKRYGNESKFLLVDVLKKELNNIKITL